MPHVIISIIDDESDLTYMYVISDFTDLTSQTDQVKFNRSNVINSIIICTNKIETNFTVRRLKAFEKVRLIFSLFCQAISVARKYSWFIFFVSRILLPILTMHLYYFYLQQGRYSTDSTHKDVLRGKLSLCKRGQDFVLKQLEFGVEMFSKVLTGNFDVHEFVNNMDLGDTEDDNTVLK